jgi:hypothetical protein
LVFLKLLEILTKAVATCFIVIQVPFDFNSQIFQKILIILDERKLKNPM